MNQKRKIIVCLVVLALLLATALLVNKFGGGILHSPAVLREKIASAGALAPLLYIGFYAALTVLFIPGAALTILGGVLFGTLFGTLYTVIGATIGAMLAFLLARFFGDALIRRIEQVKSKKFLAYYKRIEEHGLSTVLFLRFVPLFPFNALNYALGFTAIRFRDYFLGTLIGIIPGTLAYVYFGDSLASLNPLYVGLAVLLLILLSFVAGKLEKKLNK